MNKKILIVDDESDMIDVLRDLLEMEGYDVFSAYNSESALIIFNEMQPDLIMTDMMMPGMNGLYLIRKIREGSHNPTIPIILFTSMVSLKDYKDGGWQVFIKKPTNIDIILESINDLLGQSKTH